jgi:hypothetical protein
VVAQLAARSDTASEATDTRAAGAGVLARGAVVAAVWLAVRGAWALGWVTVPADRWWTVTGAVWLVDELVALAGAGPP